jgi:CRISPR/Cas system CSM-associated protein Csm2 small subunit
MNDDEIFKQLLELSETQEQVQYLTRENDKIKDGKIESLQRDVGQLQRQLMDASIQKREAESMTMAIIDKLIKKATDYDNSY